MEQTPGREYERFAVDVLVEIDGQDGTPLTGRTRNISLGGLSVELPGPLQAGSDVEVRIALIFEDEQHSRRLGLPLHVIWSTPLGQAHQIGGRFGELSGEQLEYLDVFLTFLEVVPWSEPGATLEQQRG
jgi:c-di-GMP-binding flagellar brake protein YcgR